MPKTQSPRAKILRAAAACSGLALLWSSLHAVACIQEVDCGHRDLAPRRRPRSCHHWVRRSGGVASARPTTPPAYPAGGSSDGAVGGRVARTARRESSDTANRDSAKRDGRRTADSRRSSRRARRPQNAAADRPNAARKNISRVRAGARHASRAHSTARRRRNRGTEAAQRQVLGSLCKRAAFRTREP